MPAVKSEPAAIAELRLTTNTAVAVWFLTVVMARIVAILFCQTSGLLWPGFSLRKEKTMKKKEQPPQGKVLNPEKDFSDKSQEKSDKDAIIQEFFKGLERHF